MPTPNVKCKICSKDFYAKPNWIKNGHGKYCSMLCKREAQKNGKVVKCFECRKEVYKRGKALEHSKSGKYFCGKSCQAVWRNQEFRGARHGNWRGGEHVKYREILSSNKIKPICKVCKATDERVLCAHHIDRNRKNNNISNLVWVCRNCHHLVHYYNVVV